MEVSPRENPSLWTSQTFSDSYQACSAAICSSLFTCRHRKETEVSAGGGVEPLMRPCKGEWGVCGWGEGGTASRPPSAACFFGGGVRSFKSNYQASGGREDGKPGLDFLHLAD